MSPPNQQSNPSPSREETADAPVVVAPRVLLVVNDPQRRQRMQEVMATCAPQCEVEVVDSVLDGMARSTRMPAHFLVVDMALDRPVVPALVRYLARVAPQATMHVFDTLAGQARNDSLDNSDQSGISDFGDDRSEQALADMEAALMSWLSTQLAAAPGS